MRLLGFMQELEVGAKRYVDVLNDETYKSGVFYGSKEPTVTGPMVDQGTIFADLNNETFRDNANQAVHRFVQVRESTKADEATQKVTMKNQLSQVATPA